jgi:K+-sensing histidine kinase KdpD
VIDEAVAAQKDGLASVGAVVENLVPADLPKLHVDGPRFRRIFELLFRDQIVNLQRGGVIRCRASLAPARPDGPQEIDIVVTDNGPGLPGDAIRSVFDPFFVRSGDTQNFGVCLMAVYFLVYHHGGRIIVESLPEGGLGFRIAMPIDGKDRENPEKGNDFVARVMTNERLWERLLSQP